MLCRYNIELSGPSPSVPRSIIPREELANWKHANQLLRDANAQAEELIRLTEEKCEVLLEKASFNIWQRVDAQLKRWERSRQTMCDNLEHYATQITNQAIHNLLDEIVAPQRMAALIKQLLKSQVDEISATLVCHPHDLKEVTHCLARYGSTVWKLKADTSIDSQTLVLKTDEGDFRISWNDMRNALYEQVRDRRIDI